MNTLNANQITVVWDNGMQKFVVIGGGLPRGICWSKHERLGDAVKECHGLADEMSLEVV